VEAELSPFTIVKIDHRETPNDNPNVKVDIGLPELPHLLVCPLSREVEFFISDYRMLADPLAVTTARARTIDSLALEFRKVERDSLQADFFVEFKLVGYVHPVHVFGGNVVKKLPF